MLNDMSKRKLKGKESVYISFTPYGRDWKVFLDLWVSGKVKAWVSFKSHSINAQRINRKVKALIDYE